MYFDQLIEFIPYFIYFRFPFAFEIYVYKVMDLILIIMCQKPYFPVTACAPFYFKTGPSKTFKESE